MFAPPTPEQRATILAAVAHAPNGIALDAISRLFVPPPDSRRLKEWLDRLSADVYPSGEGRNALYVAADPEDLLKAYPEPPAPPPTTSGAPTSAPTSAPAADSPSAAPAAATPPPASPLQQAPAISPAPSVTPSGGPPTVPGPNAPGATPAGEGLPAVGSAKEGDPALHQTSDPDFPKMLELAIPVIVTCKFNRTQTIAQLRSHAAKNGKVGRGMGAYVKYGLGKLDQLTAADVDIYGITPAEFAAWRLAFSPPSDPRSAPPAAKPPTVSSPAAAPTAAKRPILPPDAPRDPLPEPEADESPAAATASRPPEDELLFSGGPDLAKVVHGVRAGKLFRYALVFTKPLLSWQRMPVVIGWAIALRLLFLQDPFPSVKLVLSLVPVAGIPWVAYRWVDRARERAGFSLGEAVVVLLLGGWVGLWAARMIIGFTVSLRYSIG